MQNAAWGQLSINGVLAGLHGHESKDRKLSLPPPHHHHWRGLRGHRLASSPPHPTPHAIKTTHVSEQVLNQGAHHHPPVDKGRESAQETSLGVPWWVG